MGWNRVGGFYGPLAVFHRFGAHILPPSESSAVELRIPQIVREGLIADQFAVPNPFIRHELVSSRASLNPNYRSSTTLWQGQHESFSRSRA